MPLLRNDPDLLSAFRAGERSALERVYRHYVRSLEAYFRGLCRSAGVPDFARGNAVQDLLQEAFIRAFSPSAREAYDGVRDFLPYLRVIARNCFIDALRKRRSELPIALEDPCTQLDEIDAEAAYEPEVLATLEIYLKNLSPLLGGVYEMRFVLGLSQEVACERLGLSRRSLRTHEQHLRRGLRKALVLAGLLRREPTLGFGALQTSRE
jgi:RNA polymerase sigma factor (sigma-70 family)